MIDESELTLCECVHCGRMYVVATDNDASNARGDECDCGAELYPIRKKIMLGKALPYTAGPAPWPPIKENHNV